MWQLELFTRRNTLQIVHSVSGNVVFKHLKQLFLCLSRISCEVKCTVSECKLQTFNSSACHQSLPKWHLLQFLKKSFIPLPPYSYNYHEHKSYNRFRFVSHKQKDNGMTGPNTKRPLFHTKMMEQFRFFDLRLSCYFL